MPCFPVQTGQKGESLRNSGVLRNNYFIYTLLDQIMIKTGQPAREAGAKPQLPPEKIAAGLGQLPSAGSWVDDPA